MLIVSVQKFGKNTQNIVNELNKIKGIMAIRTDTGCITPLMQIGLKKNTKQFYITTCIKDIKNVNKWADYIAIDCRKENPELFDLLEYCKKNKINIIADIKEKYDIDNLNNYKSIIKYIATTFDFDKNIKEKCSIIKYAKKKGFKVIAEGGYNEKTEIIKAIKSGADHICIGAGIFSFIDKTKYYADIIRGCK
jgi:putative N-acetylmannosamine-6-phosphate epimerase